MKLETVNLVEKRTMGSYVLVREACQQHKELISRTLSYNSRMLESLLLLFIEDFYTADQPKGSSS